jgi:putative glutamine amidotransferase
MKKPLIGLTTLIDEEQDSYWMLPLYTQAVARSGGVPVILPPLSDTSGAASAVDALDGLLFTGGHDIDPNYYGEERHSSIGKISAERDVSEFLLMKRPPPRTNLFSVSAGDSTAEHLFRRNAVSGSSVPIRYRHQT